MTIRADRRATDNKGFAIAGVLCFVETFVVGESVVLRMNGSAYSPRHRKPPKRYASPMAQCKLETFGILMSFTLQNYMMVFINIQNLRKLFGI